MNLDRRQLRDYFSVIVRPIPQSIGWMGFWADSLMKLENEEGGHLRPRSREAGMAPREISTGCPTVVKSSGARLG